MPFARRVSLLLIALACFVAVPAWAQSDPVYRPPSRFAIGLEGGFNMSTLHHSGGPAASWAPGFLAGVFFTPKPHAVTWQVGGQIQDKRAVIGDLTWRTLRLEAPVLLRVNFRGDRRYRFHLLGGGAVGMRLESSLRSDDGTIDLSGITPLFEYSAVLGGGMDIGQVSIGVRIHQGLNTTKIVIDDLDTRSRSLVVVIGYRIQ
jgi:hypothetical protein